MEKHVHFIGIGGIGTSALARWFLTHGHKVSGSDIYSSTITQKLRREGVEIFIGHKAKNLSKGTSLVIYSAAIPPENPELKKAQKFDIAVKSYPEAVGELTKQYKTIAVAGAHGKSTTTSLLSLVLIKACLDPTVIVGTNLNEFSNSNFRKGKSDYLILEADEYQKSFLHYSPIAAIITNIDREHLDVYKNLKEIKRVFLKFISNIQRGGVLVVNKDDKNLFSLKNKIQKIAKKNNLKVFWYSIKNQSKNNFKTSDVQELKRILKIPGQHNLSNALAVYTLAKSLKIKDKNIFDAISRYRGAWRRMELRGELRIKNKELRIKQKGIIHNSLFKIPVYDDYAHHPTEIKATLSGIAQKWPKSTLICVFQPHQAQRLKTLFKDFVRAFDTADFLILLPIFQVQGRDKLSQNVNSEKLALAIKRRLKNLKPQNSKLKTVIHLPHSKKLPEILKKNLLKTKSPKLKAVIVMMGAGDIYKMTDNLIK